MIEYRSGNIFDSEMQTLVNAVNTVGVMGKGLALQFKQRYPEMFAEYRLKCESGELTIGSLHLFRGPDRWILNFPTKRHYRSKSRLADIETGLARLRESYEAMGIESLAVPALGCGYGGLDWQEVRSVIERYLNGLPIRVEVYAPGGTAEEQDEGIVEAKRDENETPGQLRLFE